MAHRAFVITDIIIIIITIIIIIIIIIIIVISLPLEKNILCKYFIYHIKLLPTFATCSAVEL